MAWERLLKEAGLELAPGEGISWLEHHMGKCTKVVLCCMFNVVHLKGGHTSCLAMAEGPEVGTSNSGNVVRPFLKRQVRWSGIPISLRIFHSLL